MTAFDLDRTSARQIEGGGTKIEWTGQKARWLLRTTQAPYIFTITSALFPTVSHCLVSTFRRHPRHRRAE